MTLLTIIFVSPLKFRDYGAVYFCGEKSEHLTSVLDSFAISLSRLTLKQHFHIVSYVHAT